MTTDHGDASGTGLLLAGRSGLAPGTRRLGVGPRRLRRSCPRSPEPADVVGRTASGAALSGRHRRQHGRRLRAWYRARRRGGVHRYLRHRLLRQRRRPRPTRPAGCPGSPTPAGAYLPLSCTINAARILTMTAELLGVDLDDLGRTGAVPLPPARTGRSFLPYLDGERTPNRPSATGVLRGLTSGTTRADLARAAVEALLCSLADAIDALGVTPRRVLVIGGAARNRAVQAPGARGVGHRCRLRRAGGVRGTGRGPAGGLGVVRQRGPAGVAGPGLHDVTGPRRRRRCGSGTRRCGTRPRSW